MNKRIGEEKIQLMDGRVLECFPLQTSLCEANNELELDTTGVHLSTKKSKKLEKAEDDREEEEKEQEQEKLFINNAFVFWEDRELILSDSRLFLCPLPFSQSAIAYTGTSGFRNPTLGVFIEFWENCPNANIVDSNGRRWLLYHIAGSPLSGSNKCAFINARGEMKNEPVRPFISVWPVFIDINARYGRAKTKYESFSLRQTLTTILNHRIGKG